MSEALAAGVTPRLIAAGYQLVDRHLQGTGSPTEPDELCFERVTGDELEIMSFVFGKHGMPRFHLRLARKKLAPPNEFVRTAYLVRSQKRYCDEWGKPYGLPLFLWPDFLAEKAVKSAVGKLDQALRFLESGERGPNISLQPNVKPFVPVAGG
jgi:hypothetical protein